MKIAVLILCFQLVVSTSEAHKEGAALTDAPGSDGQVGKVYGSGDFTSPAVTLGTAIKDSDRYKGKKVVISGRLKDVCTKVGCWVKITDGENTVRAVMLDHGFTVPADVKNKVARIEGFIEQKELPASVARHYMKDEGRPSTEISKVNGPQKVYEFTAHAVQITDR